MRSHRRRARARALGATRVRLIARFHALHARNARERAVGAVAARSFRVDILRRRTRVVGHLDARTRRASRVVFVFAISSRATRFSGSRANALPSAPRLAVMRAADVAFVDVERRSYNRFYALKLFARLRARGGRLRVSPGALGGVRRGLGVFSTVARRRFVGGVVLDERARDLFHVRPLRP